MKAKRRKDRIMSKLLEGLLAQASEVDLETADRPSREDSEEGTVLGKLPERLQRLYVVMIVTGNRLKEAAEALKRELIAKRSELSPNAVAELSRPVFLQESRVKLAKTVFWAEVAEEFPATLDNQYGTVGITKDWEVVGLPQPAISIMSILMP